MRSRDAERALRWRLNNPEKYRAKVERQLAQRRNMDPTDRRRDNRNRMLKSRYGITLEQFDAALAAQDGVCKVCASTDDFHVDHDHSSGRVRGILCGPCNRMLGMARDDIAVLEAAIRYLKEQK